jgi:hypothetical protein
MQLVKQQLSGDISSRYLFRLRFAATPNTPTPQLLAAALCCCRHCFFGPELKAWALKNELRQ